MYSTGHGRRLSLTVLFLVSMWGTTYADTAGPAVLFKDINQASSGSNPANFAVLNGQVFFTADDGSGLGLWRSDGTAVGTVLVERVSVNQIVAAQSTIYFTTRWDCSLWRTNGTAAPTAVPGGECVFDLNDVASVQDTLFFAAFDSSGGQVNGCGVD